MLTIVALAGAAAAHPHCAGRPVLIRILENGDIHWGSQYVSSPRVYRKLLAVTAHEPFPNARIVAEGKTRYDMVAAFLAKAQKAGFPCLGFVGIETRD